MTSRFATAKERILEGLDDIVPELFGSGRKSSIRYQDRWAVVNKWRGGAEIDQMSVWRRGGRRGAFKDYGGVAKGDAIDLVAYGLFGDVTDETRLQAVAWAEDRFGIRNMSPAERAALDAADDRRRKQVAATEQKKQAGDRDRARKFHFSCEAQILGTPVEIYLNSRGIRLEEVPHLAPTLRYHPDCEYWMGAQRDGEGHKIGTSPRFPAMVAMMVTSDGHLGANHYTFLEPDGSSKLATRIRGYLDDAGKPKSAKLMFPASSGMIIPLTYGPHGLRARDAAAAGKSDWWGFTEGIEDGLSAAMADDRLRMHAAGSLAHLMGIPDHPACKGYLIFKDNDWGKPQAQAQFDQAIVRLRSFGKPVAELAVPASWGKDVNDALRMEN